MSTHVQQPVAAVATPAAQRPPSAWWRLRWTIRTLLILFTVLGLFLAWIGRTIRAVQHRAALATALEGESVPDLWPNWSSIRTSDFEPNWIAIALGDWSSVDLTDIDISYRQNVNDELLEQAAVFRNLEDVSVNGQAVTDRSFAAFRGMSELKTVTIEACDISDATLEHLATLPKLEDLTLRGVSVTDKGLAQLGKLPKLTSLTVEFTLITPTAIKDFQDARPECVVGFVPAGGKPQVEAAKGIMRRDANLLYDADTRLITAMIFDMHEKPWRSQDWALLHAIPEIQAVTIDDLPDAAEAVRQVRKLPNVERLSLKSLDTTPADIATLADYPKLAELHFQPDDLTDAHLAAIGKLTSLTKLEIEPDGGSISKRGIEAICRLTSLKHLKLSNVAFLDEDLEPLTALTALVVLDLSATPITDQALDRVLALPQLRELKLNETQITGIGAQRIMKARHIQSATWEETRIKPEFFVRPAAAAP
jgi:hypothetical protein